MIKIILKENIQIKENQPSQVPGARFLGSAEGYMVYEIRSYEAARHLGRKTVWDISVPYESRWYEEYVKTLGPPVILINASTGEKILVMGDFVRDRNDSELSSDKEVFFQNIVKTLKANQSQENYVDLGDVGNALDKINK